MNATSSTYRPTVDAVVVASVSGGKDSTAMLLHLREIGLLRVRPVYFDVGWDHPVTLDHLDLLERVLGNTIERLRAEVALPDELREEAEEIERIAGLSSSPFIRTCLAKGIFPRRTVRWCTSDLKVAVARRAVRDVYAAGEVPVNAIGVRAAESAARSKLPETEISPSLDCLVWRPLIRWSEADVLEIHRRHGVPLNPLYLRGAERVGCWPCVMCSKSELRLVGQDDARVDAIRALEQAVQRRHAARAEARGEVVARPPTLFAAPRRDEAGERHGWEIDRMLRWARTSRGASLDQEHLFDTEPEDPNAGCMRWGLCEGVER